MPRPEMTDPESGLLYSRGMEYTTTGGIRQSARFWQCVIVGTTVATRYGRCGTMGLVTVNHYSETHYAEKKFNGLLRTRDRSRSHFSSRYSSASFFIPAPIANLASSSRRRGVSYTGSGGSNPNAGFAVIAYYSEALAKSEEYEPAFPDSLYTAIATERLSARRIAFASLAGYSIDETLALDLSDDDLAVMAGLTLMGQNLNLSNI